MGRVQPLEFFRQKSSGGHRTDLRSRGCDTKEKTEHRSRLICRCVSRVHTAANPICLALSLTVFKLRQSLLIVFTQNDHDLTNFPNLTKKQTYRSHVYILNRCRMYEMTDTVTFFIA